MAYKWGKLNVNFNLVKDSIPEYTRNINKSVMKGQNSIYKNDKEFQSNFFQRKYQNYQYDH